MSKLLWIGTVISAIAALLGFQMDGSQNPPVNINMPIVSFVYSHGGSSTYEIYSYEVAKDEETGAMTVYYDLNCGYETYELPADAELKQALSEIIDGHNLRKWDGFKETNSMVLDGTNFSLHVSFEDGTEISAHGSNSFPGGYGEAAEAIDGLFLDFLKKNGINREGGFY